MNRALLQLGIDLVKENATECVMIIKSDSDFEFIASSRTYAWGALNRATGILERSEGDTEDAT
jgi:hypothetical protein